ncbi:MAG: hypothetical protein A2V70_13245 [Planctomycetes bacterium RBG_13_63_9]|nr:MAG: hypothetical protein A2V70_13245 [Planctomycetes bacterium RBG_13_63_9]
MGIRFYCPSGHKLNVKEYQAGMKGICPVCGTRVQIPVESTRKSSKAERGDAGRRGSASGAAPQTPSTTEGRFSAEVDVAGDPPVMAAAEPSDAFAIGAGPAKVDSLGLAGQPRSGAVDPLAEAGDAVWYVRPASGGQFGPASGEVMRTWIDEGRVSGKCLVWREGWRDWQEASQVFTQLGNGWNPSALDQIAANEPSARAVGYRRPRLRQRSQTSQAAVIILLIFAVIVLACVFVWVLSRAPEAGTSQLDETAAVAFMIRFPGSL